MWPWHKKGMTSNIAHDAFSHVTDWVFDLDNTLYPHHSNLFAQVDVRITSFVSELLSLPRDEAHRGRVVTLDEVLP